MRQKTNYIQLMLLYPYYKTIFSMIFKLKKGRNEYSIFRTKCVKTLKGWSPKYDDPNQPIALSPD